MIILKSPQEIDRMRAASRVVAEILEELREMVKPGVSTLELNRHAEQALRARKAQPAFKGYHGYPAVLCTSVNEEVVHGIPSPRRVLREGDIIGLDFGAVCDGYFGDAAVTVGVGGITPEAERLIQATEEALYLAIAKAVPGNRLSDVSLAVQYHVEACGYSVVREFVGHGIGRSLHEPPQVPNFGTFGHGVQLVPGMVLAIEPMVNAGGPEVEILSDGWTAVTRDRSLSAHFEHSVAITEDGPVILTCR
ncbi:MAG: type I methionyl aminopeptidase [Deltaproteobacteria bacterium]|nr:type I methionyl aminopeptidase [Deltaproteobacteria bacterium]MBI3076540.1 type I methionyl aminopeptidase [Deltaproteobacteria bacterium]